MSSSALCLGDQIMTVGADVDVAVQVGPEELRAVVLQTLDGLGRRMPVRIAPAGADDRDARVEGAYEGVGRRGATAVMSDLEHIDLSAEVSRNALCQQLRVDLLLDIAREQHPTCAEVQLEHDRDIVDCGSAIGGVERNLAAQRPINVELDAVEP